MIELSVQSKQKKSKIKIGDEFTRLTVIENMGIIDGKTCFQCMCKCGNMSEVTSNNLQTNNTKSCGCLKKELLSQRSTKHGMKGTLEYNTWINMRQRCNDINHKDYLLYGGKGITVCPEWDNFITFYNDMGHRGNGLTLDRIDSYGNYEPLNCRWASAEVQARNQRIGEKSKTGIRGVAIQAETGKYRVRITVNKKQYHIGYYDTIELAAIARKEAELKFWGKES